jgi:hypothetical protein
MYVTINSHNMGEVEGIRAVLTGATAKYVVDLIFDTIVYKWGLKIPHSPINSDSHKIRLAERHFTLVEQYASQRHISSTLAANLILNDYFSSRCGTNYAIKETQNTPSQSESNPPQHKNIKSDTDNSQVAQITPCKTKSDTDKPKTARGIGLLQNLKQ